MSGWWIVGAVGFVGGAVGLLPSGRRRRWARLSRNRQAQRQRRPSTQDEVDSVLAFLDLVGPGLRSGRSTDDAARLACDVLPETSFVSDLRGTLGRGGTVESVLARHGREAPDVRLAAWAWDLSSRTGCPLADAVDTAATLVRGRNARRRRVESASAGARATIRVLTLLPVAGPVLGLAVGVDPLTAYVASPLAWMCLGAGAILVLVGRRWVSGAVAAVARGPVLGPR